MDFWASLEHKIYYKYNKQIPEHLTKQLKEAADTVAELDRKMESINNEINIVKENDKSSEMEALLLNPRDLLLKMIKNIDVTGNYDM